MIIFRLKEVLESLGIEETLNTSFKDQVRLISWELEETLFSFKRGYAWYILEGGAVTTRYFSGEGELHREIDQGEWLGLPDAVLNVPAEHDIKVYRGSVILELPLYDLITSREVSKDFYQRILQEFARTVKPALIDAASRINYNDEVYFIEYLKKHDYSITFRSIKDLAVLLHINLRTLHRNLKKLSEKGIIERDSGRIEVVDYEALEDYLEELYLFR